MAIKTKNMTIGRTWIDVPMSKVSNLSNAEIEYWPGTVAPTTLDLGHPLKKGEGISADLFAVDGVTPAFKFRSRNFDALICVTWSE
jgi:hypothetical protein